MASSLFVPQFVKFLDSDDCLSNELVVPIKFVLKYGDRLRGNWVLQIRNGYSLYVTFDRRNCLLGGILDLFIDHGLTGGEVLVFEYVENINFKLYTIGRDGVEIQYPSIVHASQSCSPLIVRNLNGGWKFLKYVSFGDDIVDEVKIPLPFIEMFGARMSGYITYLLNNEVEYLGFCDNEKWTLKGFSKICAALGLSHFRSFDLLVFTDVGRTFRVSFYDGRNVEIILDPDVLASRQLSFSLRYPSNFVIEVQNFHMLPYCHGVDISVNYSNVTIFWKKKEMIKVFKGERCWEFEIRKRSKGKRTTIHGGWVDFRNELQLNVGDRCCFIWIDESYQRFRVEIVKAIILID